MQFFKVKSVEETFEQIEEVVKSIQETEQVAIDQALERIVAEDIYATESVPSFPKSTVDGYAVKAHETYGSTETMPGFLQVIGSISMGENVTQTVNDGESMYIPTGGMLPPGSDSVVMIEHCEDLNGLLNIYKQVAPLENVIQVGEDVKEGEVIIKKGTRLRPQELGALAAIGKTHITVYRQLTVGYLSCGDEIVPYENKEIAIGQVRDVNALTVTNLVKEWGHIAIYDGIVEDDFEEYRKRAQRLYEQVDCLILSGGSSVGAKDFTTKVIEFLGEPGVFIHGVSIKPGKPTILAMANGKPVLGLPGHPASAMIIFTLFGEKIIRKLSGEASRNKLERVYVKMTKNVHSSPGRADYIRVKLIERDGEWWAEPIIGKSGLISTLVQSDAIVEIASRQEGVSQGQLVPAIMFS